MMAPLGYALHSARKGEYVHVKMGCRPSRWELFVWFFRSRWMRWTRRLAR